MPLPLEEKHFLKKYFLLLMTWLAIATLGLAIAYLRCDHQIKFALLGNYLATVSTLASSSSTHISNFPCRLYSSIIDFIQSSYGHSLGMSFFCTKAIIYVSHFWIELWILINKSCTKTICTFYLLIWLHLLHWHALH